MLRLKGCDMGAINRFKTMEENPKDTKQEFLMVLLNTEQKNKIREAAKRENRSLSSFCLQVVLKYLQENSNSIKQEAISAVVN